MADDNSFAVYVRAVEGHRVYRYGTTQLIGWRKAPRRKVSAEVVDKKTGKVSEPAKYEEGGQRACDPRIVVPLTEAEWRRYRFTYAKRFKEGALKQATAEEYAAWLASQAPPAEPAAPANSKPASDAPTEDKPAPPKRSRKPKKE